MSKVMIVKIGSREIGGGRPIIMTWDAYCDFSRKTQGEGVTWKAVLI